MLQILLQVRMCYKLVVINKNVNFYFFFLWLSSRSYVNYFNSKYQYIFIPNSLLRSTTCNYLYEYLLIRASLEQNISLWLILVVINKDVTYIILYYISLVCYFVCVCLPISFVFSIQKTVYFTLKSVFLPNHYLLSITPGFLFSSISFS